MTETRVCQERLQSVKAVADVVCQERLQGVKELAGAVCHELSQPAQSISGNSELLLMEMPEWDLQHKRVKIIKEQIDKIKVLLNNLAEIQEYETKEYLEGSKIIDIEKSAGIIEPYYAR